MRVFDLLLLVAAALTLLSVLMPASRRVRAVFPLVLAVGLVLHLIVEAYRWQLLPLYVLIVALILFSLIPLALRRADRPRSRRRTIGVIGLVILGGLVLALEIVILVSFPLVHLPKPSGPYAVGTTYLQFADPSRPETLTDDPDDTRQFQARVWYPADRPESGDPVIYQDYQTSIDNISPGGAPEFIFGHFHLLHSHAYRDVPLSAQQPAYPVVIFSIGFLTLYEDYQIFAEEFASQGYVVVIPDTPYEWQAVRQPDGSTVSYNQAHADAFHQNEDDITPLWEQYWEDDTTAEERDALSRQMLDGETFMDGVLRVRVADIRFVVDELARLNSVEDASLLSGKLDLNRLGIAGHSMGGAVAGQTCLEDDRFQACANLDGFQWGDVVEGTIHQPFMLIYSEQFDHGTDYILGNLTNETYVFMIKGTKHMNFQDMPVVIPGTRVIGLAGSISGTRSQRITNDYLLAFFGKYLNGEASDVLDSSTPPYREVRFQSRP